MQMGKVVRGTYVDHKIPHRGDYKLFSDPANLQTLCKIHANATKQKEELTGTTQGCSLTGWPLGEEHPWNNGGKAPPRRTTVSTHTIHSLKRRKRK